MEIHCKRCHQIVPEDACFCPGCGLPQLLLSSETAISNDIAESGSEAGNEPVRFAGEIAWRSAIRAAITAGVPAGLICSGPSPLQGFALVWMATAAAWAVILYMRTERPAWLPSGAGVRIGLVTGIVASWMGFAANGIYIFAQRFWMHQGGELDSLYGTLVIEPFKQVTKQQLAGLSAADAAQAQGVYNWMLAGLQAPEGHAWMLTFSIFMHSCSLALYAILGGAVGAWLIRMHPAKPMVDGVPGAGIIYFASLAAA